MAAASFKSAPIRRNSWLVPVGMVLIAMVLRAQTFGNPLIEFDEQFYRLAGERMLDGAMPYVDIWDRKPIGLFLLFAGAAAIGGSHALSYQLLATVFAGLTGWVVALLARRLTRRSFAPSLAGVLYIAWLNLLQGEGGQASVFYALPVALAALLVLRQVNGERPVGRLAADGALAMLLVGLAVQIKYTAVIEGAFFGVVLLWTAWRARAATSSLIALTALWVSLALLPTLLAWISFAAMGYGGEWLFANITSIFLRTPMPMIDWLEELAGGLGAALLLIIAGLAGWRIAPKTPAVRFIGGWVLAALLALVAMRSFVPHYWIPLTVPLAVLAAPALAHHRRAGLILTLVALIAGQWLVGHFIAGKGNGATVERMAKAIGPVGTAPGCLFVFDGFPALYQEVDSCLPSRFAFPGHLNGMMEAGSIGVDPVAEVSRIMATRPAAVVLDEPRWSLQNKDTAAVVDRALAADYVLVLREPTGPGRFRLVYRLRPAAVAPIQATPRD